MMLLGYDFVLQLNLQLEIQSCMILEKVTPVVVVTLVIMLPRKDKQNPKINKTHQATNSLKDTKSNQKNYLHPFSLTFLVDVLFRKMNTINDESYKLCFQTWFTPKKKKISSK